MDINTRIGDYEILEELGRGGMGRVYRVRNVISDRVEAMKVLLPDLVSQADLESRFLREIKVLASLEHPHIATLRTAMKDGDRVVMIMEYVDGETLAQRLKRGPIPVADAIEYINQVLDALAYAHAQGVIHRDIKPANMMLTSDGMLKLTDFGIARSQNDVTLTAAGTTTGSLFYMSPEQVNAEPTDARSDLYSVGISLYEMVTGQRPFQADSDFAVMVAHLKEMPRPPIELEPTLGAELNAVIMKAIAKSRDERYQTADDFRTALETVPAFATTPGEAAVPAPMPIFSSSQAETIVSAKRATGTVPPITPARVRTLMDAPLPGSAPAVPAVPQPVMRKPANAVLYMAIGGVFAIGALVAAALYINSAAPASAGTAPATATPTAATPVTAPAPAAPAAAATASGAGASVAGSPAADGATPTPPAATTPPATAEAPSAASATATAASSPAPASSLAPAAAPPSTTARSGAPASTAPQSGDARARPVTPARAPASASGSTAAREATPSQPMEPAVDFDELEAEIDQLSARVVAINASLDRLQQEQARQGLGLRGDIAARQQTMNSNITRAAEAVTQKNAARAQRFKAAAEADVEALERFLGR